jgi:hypothetical protein
MACFIAVLRTGGRLLSTVYASDPAQLAERGITAVKQARKEGEMRTNSREG